jgi:kinesin family protein 3/17
LQRKEQLLQLEAQEKTSLEKLIKEMEQQLVSGGMALQSKEQEKAKVFREYQAKIKQERAKQKKLREEKQKQDEELLDVKRVYKDLQEEARENGKAVQILRQKLNEAKQEIRDLKDEHQCEHDEMLDTIRKQGYDLKFYQRLVKMLMKDEEIAKVKLKSEYDEDREDWVVPPF